MPTKDQIELFIYWVEKDESDKFGINSESINEIIEWIRLIPADYEKSKEEEEEKILKEYRKWDWEHRTHS
jgi:hypothetical protein